MTNKNNQCDAAVNYGSIQQLNKKEDGKERKPIFPVTPIQAVYDARTGASLEAILAQFNAIYVQYQGSPQATRNIIPEVMRRAGLTITYMDMESNTITERANSAVQKDNDHWGLDVNWSRVDELSLSGDISVSSKGTWIVNGKDTGVKALGPKGDTGLTPWLKTIDNKLHFSYDNVTWEPCSENIAAWFRFNSTSSDSQAGTIGRIQISRDNKTWTDLSPEFRNYLRIQGYVATTSALPANQVVGTIYGVGPTYAADDTTHTNPIYRLHVWNGTSWVDNGQFTSIAAGVVQETGDSETEVMSQKAVSENINKLEGKANSYKRKLTFSGMFMNGYEGQVGYTENLPDYNGFYIPVNDTSEYKFAGMDYKSGQFACYSRGYRNNMRPYFLGLTNVVDGVFKPLPGTSVVLSVAFNSQLSDEDAYLLTLDKHLEYENNIKGAKEFISSLQSYSEDTLPLRYGNKEVTQTNIYINYKKPYTAKNVDTILYRNIVGSFDLWLVDVADNDTVSNIRHLANVVSDKASGVGYVTVPYIEMKDNQYIGVSGTFKYNSATAEGFGYRSFNQIGETLSALNDNAAVCIREVCMSDFANYAADRLSKVQPLIDAALASGNKYHIVADTESTYISDFSKDDIVAVKINSVSDSIKNLGLFTSGSWNFPVVWQTTTEELVLDKWYYIYINKAVNYDTPLFLNVYESLDEYNIDAEIVKLTNTNIENSEAISTAKKNVVMYQKVFDGKVDSLFNGANSENFTADGLLVGTSTIKLDRYYSLSSRTVRYLCVFGSDTVAKFFTDTNDTNIGVDVSNKSISINEHSENCECLEPNVPVLLEISKAYNRIIIKVCNLSSSDNKEIELTYSGPGGIGNGAIEESNIIGMQHDYYCFAKTSGSDFIIKQMAIVSAAANLKLLIYGDSITEPEGYFPSVDFKNAWTQLLIDNVNGEAISSGRGGTTITQLMTRIVNELPFIGAEYVMVTIGTNGGNTEANLSQLVEYIISQGSIPILNNIPCNESGTQTSVNAVIEKVRSKYGINGCKFDLATSVDMDGAEVDKTKMWWENYSSSHNVYHHPNVKGSKSMFARLKIDVPEIF